MSEPLTSSLWAALEYASGAALSARAAKAEGLAQVSAGLHSQGGGGDGRTGRARAATGTKVHAAYRWQPRHMVTAVNPYAGLSNQAYPQLLRTPGGALGRQAASRA